MSTAAAPQPAVKQGPVRLALIVGPDTMRHIGRIIRHLVVGLLDEMFHVTVVVPAGADLSLLPTPPVDVITYVRPRFRFRHRPFNEWLAEQLAKRNIELLHALDGHAIQIAHEISLLGEWPFLASVLALETPRSLTPPAPLCRAILPASLSIRTRLLSAPGISEDLIQVVRPGVHQQRQPTCFRVPENSPAIIAGGRLDVYEPFAAVLDAIDALRKAKYDLICFIIGNGRAEHRLRQRAENLDLMHNVTFVDFPSHSQLAGIFAAADMFIFPQSSGQVEVEVLDAMAAGIPVLVGGPCVGDFVIEPETALSYVGYDPADLADKLHRLLDDHQMAHSLAASALNYLRENHSPARMVAELAQLYRKHALTGRTLKIG